MSIYKKGLIIINPFNHGSAQALKTRKAAIKKKNI